MKSAFAHLKSLYRDRAQIGLEQCIELLDCLIFLHRLSVSLRNLNEAKYFLKQLNLMADTYKGAFEAAIGDLSQDFHIFVGKAEFFDPLLCESILKSYKFESFFIEKGVRSKFQEIQGLLHF